MHQVDLTYLCGAPPPGSKYAIRGEDELGGKHLAPDALVKTGLAQNSVRESSSE